MKYGWHTILLLVPRLQWMLPCIGYKNNAAKNTEVYLLELVFSFSLGKYSEVELLDHITVLSLIFWGIYTLFHSGCTGVQSQKGSLSPPPHQHLLPVVFWIVVVLTGARWHIPAVLISVSLMTGAVQHFFMCLLAICILLQRNVCSSSLPIY